MTAPAMVEEHLTVPALAARLGVSAKTVSRWIAAGRRTRGADGIWPAFRPGGRVVLVPASAVRRFLEARKA